MALPHDFTAVPINVYNNDDIHDDCSTDGCPFINEVRSANTDNEVLWSKYFYFRESIKEPLADSIGESVDYLDALTFHDF